MKDLQLYRLILAVAGELRQRGSWTGETHIQKVGYFLQDLMGVPLEAEYILYKHGPYSFDLRRTLAAMRAYQYVEWQPNPYPYGPTLIEGSLAGTLRRFSKEPAEYHDRIAFAAQWLGPKRVSELERLGTALYVTLTEDIPSQDRVARICELKPHVAPAEAQAAVAELDTMIAQARQQGLIPVRSTQDVVQ
jgi:uncharacterized protein YwgA